MLLPAFYTYGRGAEDVRFVFIVLPLIILISLYSINKWKIKRKNLMVLEVLLTFATQSFRFGGGSLGFPEPNNRFILVCKLNNKCFNSYTNFLIMLCQSFLPLRLSNVALSLKLGYFPETLSYDANLTQVMSQVITQALSI